MPAVESICRTSNLALYTTVELDRRRKAENLFLVRVLEVNMCCLTADS